MRKTTGISRRGWLFFLSSGLWGQSSYAVIAGSVFRETGHAFGGVDVRMRPVTASKKNKPQRFQTNTRGEFSFRVPAGEMEYELEIAVRGYRTEVKRVKIEGEERVEQNFVLDRAR